MRAEEAGRVDTVLSVLSACGYAAAVANQARAPVLPAAGPAPERRLSTRSERFPLMDSLRAIAVLSVLVGHASFMVAIAGTDELTHIRFDFGVRAFFVVSGFLIYRPWVRARLRAEPYPDRGVYAWHRLLRIVPAYWVALTIITVWLGTAGVFTWSGVPIYYGFVQAYSANHATGGLLQAWSLCVEVAFYVFVPLWAMVMRRLRATDPSRRFRQELIGAGLLLAVGLAYKVIVVEAGALEHSTALQLNLLTFLDDFAVGIALAAVSVWYHGREHESRVLRLLDRRPWLPWLVALAAMATVSYGIGITGNLAERYTRTQYLERHYLYLLMAVGLVLPAIFGDPTRGWVRKLLGNRVLLYIGLVSYGIFLYHFAVLQQLQRWGFQDVAGGKLAWLWLVAGTAGATLIASLSYYLLERPFLRLKRLFDGRVKPRRSEAVVEPVPVPRPR
jgi:peptidoglycan/LPS O-acetylase OafA/YrhL